MKIKKLKIGLALGSGGARGLAHIGVLKVLQENNIPIDFIAGSSIGSWVGAWYARDQSIKALEEFSLGVNWKMMAEVLFDFSWGGGLMSGEKAEKFIAKNLGEIKFEDLNIPLSVVATDLRSGDKVVFQQGLLSTAIRASMSVPVFFKPVAIDNFLLSDGGLSEPVPVSTVRAMGADIVIAVNLDAKHLFYPAEETFNSLSTLSQQAFNIARYNLARAETVKADIVIEPDTKIFGVVGWKDFLEPQKVIASGEAAMREQIEKLKKLL